MEQKQGFSKDFFLVVIGQIISLFGNAVIRFALPLHLLNETGSAALLGVVSGCAFIPVVLMSPVGGLIADKVNKKYIMVVLDFFTALMVGLFLVLYGKINLVTIILLLLFLLYGISGAYQPSVQASVPLLVSQDKIMPANAMINMISSLSGLLGPALGGIAYQLWGILPVLKMCMACFVFSAVMEIFIRIPFQKGQTKEAVLPSAVKDLKESLHFIRKEKPQIGHIAICCAGINLLLSSLLIIGLPVIVLQMLHFPGNDASQMYGFLQAFLAVGGLAGGLGAGILSSRINIKNSWKLLLCAALCLIPMGISLMQSQNVYLVYTVFAAGGFLMMLFSTIFTIQALSYIQIVTPAGLVGKVIAWTITISTCAQPLGQFIYGFLFEELKGYEWSLFCGASIATALIAVYCKQVVKGMEAPAPNAECRTV